MSLTNIKTIQNSTQVDLLDYFYPVGIIYKSFDSSFDPNVTWGGTWVKVSDRFLYGSNVGKCCGSSSITLCSCNIPNITGTLGGYTCVFSGCTRILTNTATVYINATLPGAACRSDLCYVCCVCQKYDNGSTSWSRVSSGTYSCNYYTGKGSKIAYSTYRLCGSLKTCSISISSTSKGAYCTYTAFCFPSQTVSSVGCYCPIDIIPAYYGVYIWRRTA